MSNKAEQVIDRLRGQLQNCVNVLSAVNRGRWMKDKVNEHIEAANKCLYETLHADISSAPTPPASAEGLDKGRLLKIAAGLLDAGWASDIAEDWPARVSSSTVAFQAAQDRERRRLIAMELRKIFDKQGGE